MKSLGKDIFRGLDKGGYPHVWDSLCILGPTASGKTKFAVELALSMGHWENGSFVHGAEILSADSRQVYRGMDIGTGKDKGDYKADMGEYVNKCRECGIESLWGIGIREAADGRFAGLFTEVPCHLIDIADAGVKYNIFEYQRDFAKAYAGVLERGRIPLICGGSGLYIEAATRGYVLKEVLPDNDLRRRLDVMEMGFLKELLIWLKSARGTVPHNNTDFDTKKRVIRAVEVELAECSACCGIEQVLGYFKKDDRAGFVKAAGICGSGEIRCVTGGDALLLPERCRYIGIMADRDMRNARIDARLHARLEEGMLDEVRGLLDAGIPAEDLIYYGLEYKFVTQYLIGELEYEEMERKLKIAIHQFAKRQMTWFRGMERRGINIEWGYWADQCGTLFGL